MSAENGGERVEDNREKKGPQPLGAGIADLDRKQLCDLIVRLCDLVQRDVGTGGYRGGIFPDNLSLSEEGEPVLGPAAPGDWTGQERDFLAPELFWHGEKGPSADVYSLGLLLYYAVNCARLPFYKSGENGARQRRMNGEPITPPKAAGRRLSEIIVRATAFQASERYQSVEELKAALQSCVSNIYLSGPVSAETLYHKKEEDLSSIEKMMLDILRREENPEIVKTEWDEEEEPKGPIVGPLMDEEKPAGPELPQETPAEEPPAETPETPETPAEPEPVVILTEDRNPELEPVVISRSTPPQYQNSAERERKIASKVRRRRLRPVVIVLLVVIILLSAAAIYDHIQLRDLKGRLAGPAVTAELPEKGLPPLETAPVPVVVLTPSPEPLPLDTPVPAQPEQPKESRYELIVSDVSWQSARDSAANAGGHLVVINDEAEYRRVLELVKQQDISYVWLGCRRVDGEMTWLNDASVSYWPWISGEPSYFDGDVAEDYLMLSLVNGNWGYNDNRNDPAGDYPAFYSGRIAYIIEFEG